MSRVPYCPNTLSYRPRIEFGDTTPKMANPAHENGGSDRKSESFDSFSGLDQLRTRRFTDGSYRSRTITGGRRTSFGSSQQYKAGQTGTYREPLDRKASGLRVEQLLKLRKRKLKESERNGDEMEIFRLKNLNILDDIENPIDNEDPEGSSIHEVESLSKCELDGSMAPPAPSRAINQGHTAKLCWHMRLQSAYGVQVPTEFTSCATHRAPDQPPTPASSKRSTLNFTSPTSTRSSTISSSARSRSSTGESATLYETDITSSPDSPTLKTPCDERLPPYQPALKIEPEEEDPFLYIGKYIHHHTKPQKPSTSQKSSATLKHSNPPNCTCSTHTCRDYLSGKPSKHCPTCKLPSPQPEILAAMSRICEAQQRLAFAQGAGIWADDSEAEVKENEIGKFERLHEDARLVEMYDAEMEKRCEEGVWWEGWLIVEDLKDRGIVGSTS